MTFIDSASRQQIVERVLAAQTDRGEFLLQMKQRQQKGWEVARQCARILFEEFRVQRVVLFGSLLNHEQMTPHSDIDLAVWGLQELDYFRAVARLLDVSSEFSLDLVEVQRAQPHILKGIAKGVDL